VSFSFGVAEVNGRPVVVDAFSAMWIRAQQDGDEELIRVLQHRSDEHGGGPCYCGEAAARGAGDAG
jgi:hypothetical protein